MAGQLSLVSALLAMCLMLVSAAPMEQEPYLDHGYELQPSRGDYLNYMAGLDLAELRELVQLSLASPTEALMKQKRWGRWGDKYADNKSYGFWITALNKAGNYKRGKRSEPFIPAMSAPQPPVSAIHDLLGNKKAVRELIPDHDYSA